jgi:hypothetical protein
VKDENKHEPRSFGVSFGDIKLGATENTRLQSPVCFIGLKLVQTKLKLLWKIPSFSGATARIQYIRTLRTRENLQDYLSFIRI